jgi:hypothetical protein
VAVLVPMNPDGRRRPIHRGSHQPCRPLQVAPARLGADRHPARRRPDAGWSGGRGVQLPPATRPRSARPAGACHPPQPPTASREDGHHHHRHPTTTRSTVGVDTHGDTHVAHAGDQLGRRLATVQLPTTPAGDQHLLDWATELGQVEAFRDRGQRLRRRGAGPLVGRPWPGRGGGQPPRPPRAAARGVAGASPILLTPRAPPAPCRPGKPP